MRAVFDAAAGGDRRAQGHALAVCGLCPDQPACLQRTFSKASWPAGEGPTGVVAGLVIPATGRKREAAECLARTGGASR